MYATDVMTTRFITLKSDNTITEAVKRFQSASLEQGKHVFGLPVISCDRIEPINQALARMLLGDMGRIFVHDGGPDAIVGVLSLSDAANHRSGTCRACISSRMVG